MGLYIYQHKDWPRFVWDQPQLASLLSRVRHRGGKLLGRMESLGFNLRLEASFEILTVDVLKTSEIEGEILDAGQVRSSIARRLGLDIGALTPADRDVDGVVEMMLDATQNYPASLTAERLFSWHAGLFPTGYSGAHKIVIGKWRDNSPEDPMQVVSGPMGRETIHFRAPDAALLTDEMNTFIKWFNEATDVDAVIKAAIAHLWFVTIHPFDDGNGRVARAIADMQLSRADGSSQRFYSMSAQIRKERNAYYEILETTQKGSPDITEWLQWFLECLDRAIIATDVSLASILLKAKFWDKHSSSTFNSRQKIMLNKILDGFTGKLTSSKWAKITKSSADSAVRDINELITLGVLKKEPGGGRSTSYELNTDQ